MKCNLCGIEIVDGTYRFSYTPHAPVHPDAVYTRVCKSAIDAQLVRESEGETDLPPIAVAECINTTGKYNPKYRWLKPNEVV